MLLARQIIVVLTVLTGNRGLRFEALHLVPQFAADVLDPGQVVARVGQAALGFLASLLVLGDAGRFFEEDAQLVGLGLDDARNGALTDDGVGTRPQTSPEKEVGDVLAADLLVVDEILGLAVAGQHPLDRKLGVLRPLPGNAAQRIVEDQLDGGTRNRLAPAGAVEDHVLHRLAAQFGSLRFAEHPAHGIHHVRLAATVRPDDANQLTRQGNRRRIHEGFEASEFEFCQAHE